MKKIPVLKFLLFLALIVCTARASDAASHPAVRIVMNSGESPALKLGMERLQEYGNFKAAISHSFPVSTKSTDEVTIVLGSTRDFPALAKRWEKHSNAKADSYFIKAISSKPLVVMASGVNSRGTLFAAYQLADLLRAKADLASLDIFREPKIAERFVSFGATTHGRKVYNPELHWKTLKELPSFGYNGMIIYPGGGTPIARRSSPIDETDEGKLFLYPENTKKWKAWFSEIGKYQLDLMIAVPPVIPPGFSNKQIHDFYSGGPEPENYVVALQAQFRRYLELLTSTYPELDKFMFNSTEGATFGRNVRFFGHPDLKRFSNESYLRNNEKVMRAYFDVLADFFKADPSRVYFWTHSFGLTSDGIAKMREVLFEYPTVTIIEDDFWNNNLWPTDLPAMAYLPKPLRKNISKKNPFALFQIATDGEYFGGGSLPNAYPDSHIRTANEAVDRNARMIIQRLDLHDRTPYGTAFGTMEIVPYAASKQVWKPTPGKSEIWREWAESRFGKKAAPHVINALQESKTVLSKGLSCNGMDLLCVGSEFSPHQWMKDDSGVTRFFLFGKPGRPLLKKSSGDVILSGEYSVYQMRTRSIAIADFRKNQELARAAVQRGLQEIEKAKPNLEPGDYKMLRDIFVNGENVLKAVRLLGEVAYATNIRLDNFDHVKNPEAFFQNAVAEMEAYLKENKLIPGMTENLQKIVESYKKVAANAR